MSRREAPTIEVRRDVQDGYNRAVQKKLETTVWNTGGCSSWYLDKNGVNSVIYPGFTWWFRMRTAKFDPSKYVLEAKPPAPSAEPTLAATR
jgi:hypothetical protein